MRIGRSHNIFTPSFQGINRSQERLSKVESKKKKENDQKDKKRGMEEKERMKGSCFERWRETTRGIAGWKEAKWNEVGGRRLKGKEIYRMRFRFRGEGPSFNLCRRVESWCGREGKKKDTGEREWHCLFLIRLKCWWKGGEVEISVHSKEREKRNRW